MTVTRDFSSMLNQYLPYEMMKEELVKMDYFLSKIPQDNNWKGAALKVPFQAGMPSSYKYGGIVPAAEISTLKPVVGSVSGYKEIWAALKFYSADLMEHDGKVNEQSFIRNLLDVIPGFLQGFKEAISMNLSGSAYFAKLTASSLANDGVIVVDRPERFTFNQKVKLVELSGTAHDVTGYVKSIDINTNTIVLVTALSGATVVDFSGGDSMTLANSPVIYRDGADSAGLTSLRSVLLSSANGGDASIYGVTKNLYPYTQAVNVSGSAITSTNILDKIFDAYTTTRQKGKGNPYTALMSYKHLGSAMKAIELSKGAFKMVNGAKASLYGWTEIEVVGVKGSMIFTGVQEMDDDVIFFLDWSSMKLFSNGFIKRHTDLNGNQWHVVRDDTAGYYFITDHLFFGDLVVHAPCKNGIIHSISY